MDSPVRKGRRERVRRHRAQGWEVLPEGEADHQRLRRALRRGGRARQGDGRAQDRRPCAVAHHADTIGQDRTKKYYLKNLCGNPYDTGVAVAHLIFGGVMDRFPKLGFNLPHAGGTFPWLIGRWDHGTKVRPELKHMKSPPSSYLRRFTYDTIGHDDRINAALVKLVGADRVTLGSDYCFDMGLDDPIATVDRLKLPKEERELVIGGNAQKLLQL